LIQQVGSERAERDGFIRTKLADECRELLDVSDLDTPRSAARHSAFAGVVLDRAVRRKRKHLCERPARLGEDCDFEAGFSALGISAACIVTFRRGFGPDGVGLLFFVPVGPS
jgi:hypothetical protein